MPRVRCLHDWRLETDWEGDPNVINGTQSWNVWRCLNCGDERQATHEEVSEHMAEAAEARADWESDR